ncbi:V-type sodium ATPase subunit C [Oxobacter pfennigii]|uniref:V-type sodium ATPase subunit C n=1 Tax=Oxobacter pfennigii TaxID=36849 RepID=A0A0P8YWV6_9CLOT|nr:V-type ATP synthase subunit C [Oxobacter pfennigii]KPU44206.1 V-type sodium ATPase subunit C [Oxobacter pfennigii]
MDNTIFAQSVARLRFLETKMLDKSKLEALVDAKSFEDCIRMLQDSVYSEYITLSSYEEGLKRSIEDLYKEMYKTSPVKEVIDILAIRYDGHNIKCLTKSKISGTDTSSIVIDAGTIPVDALKYMIKEENYKDMPDTLRQSIQKALEDYAANQDPQEIDITIDKGMYQYMLQVAKDKRQDYLLDLVKLFIDLINIKAFIRVKVQDKERELFQKIFIPGGQVDKDVFVNNLNASLDNFANKIAHTKHFTWVKAGIEDYFKDGNLGSIEKYGDNYLIDYLWKAKLIMFGPEPLAAFIIARENEIRALRIILTGKKNEVRPDVIRERLRDIYV